MILSECAFDTSKIRVIDKYAIYSAYTTVLSYALQGNSLHAVLHRLPLNVTVPHILLWLNYMSYISLDIYNMQSHTDGLQLSR